MTRQEIETAVDAYMANHLDAAYWTGLAQTSRQSAVAMAIGDVLGKVGNIDEESLTAESKLLGAIAEQAVWLARNYATIAEGRIATSERVGDLSVGYAIVGGSENGFGMSARAAAIINAERKRALSRGVRIVRG